MYDVAAAGSFAAALRWLKELRDHAAGDLVIVLIGNKADLKERREVQAAEGAAFAEEEGLLFMETSAKSGACVGEAFERAVGEAWAAARRARLVRGGGSGSEDDAPAAPPAGRRIALGVEEPAEPPPRRACCASG